MVKQYISVLDLLNERSKQLKTKNARIEEAFPMEMYIRQYRNMPLFMIQAKQLPDSEEQIQRVMCRSEIPNLIRGESYDIPYLLELEYIKQAGLGLQKAQLDMLNQLFLLLVLNWAAQIGTHHRIFQEPDAIYLKLEESRKIKSIDGTTKEGQKKIKDLVEEVYHTKFEPLEISSIAYQKKHLRGWGAYPRSTKDAFQILALVYALENESLMDWQDLSKEAYLGQTLLFAPLMLVFYLLEKKQKAYRKISWGEYQMWKDGLPDYLDPDKYRKNNHRPEWTLFTDGISKTPKKGDGEPLRTFSYGYVNYRMGNEVPNNDDQYFLLWLFDMIFETMREQGVVNNVTQISVRRLDQYIKDPEKMTGMGRVSIRLDQESLDWGSKEGNNE